MDARIHYPHAHQTNNFILTVYVMKIIAIKNMFIALPLIMAIIGLSNAQAANTADITVSLTVTQPCNLSLENTSIAFSDMLLDDIKNNPNGTQLLDLKKAFRIYADCGEHYHYTFSTAAEQSQSTPECGMSSQGGLGFCLALGNESNLISLFDGENVPAPSSNKIDSFHVIPLVDNNETIIPETYDMVITVSIEPD